ncbi:hypothetical protein C8Q75DRAFT_805339 [Abortiporus biennis]|nr:hypothetical protein C8Q75DRAFT_805339 [Abortiporus biennis]
MSSVGEPDSLQPLSSIPSFDINSTLGAMFIGILITYLVLDVLHIGFATHDAYSVIILSFLNPANVAVISWSPMAYIVCATTSDLIIRCIFINRIRRLNKTMLLSVPLFIVTIIVAGFAYATAYEIFHATNVFQLEKFNWLFSCEFSLIVFIDSTTAFLLCLSLWRLKTGFRRTDSQVDTLMRYSVQTGLITSIVAVSTLVVFLTKPQSFFYVALYFTLPKLYLNALLATLNSRDGLRSEMQSGNSEKGWNSFQLSKVVTSNAVIPGSGGEPSISLGDTGNDSTAHNEPITSFKNRPVEVTIRSDVVVDLGDTNYEGKSRFL